MRRCTLFLLVILSAALHAQNFNGVAISALPGLPFTGQQTVVWTRQVGGKTVTSRLVGTVARDSQGRTYREGHSFTVEQVDPQTTLLRFTLRDPVEGVTTDCVLATHLCTLTAAATVVKMASATANTVKEDLGSQVIDGLTVTGTRITQTPLPKALDLSQPLEKEESSTVELWHSADLKVDLSELRKYPHGDVVDVHLSITSREEPDPKIFSIPAGFSIRDDRTLRRIGGDVSAPVLIYSVEPKFTQEARSAKIGGNVLVNLIVDQNGLPTNVRVIRGVGHGLDEKAVEAVNKYRFKPAMEHGQAVPVQLNIVINFQIF